MTATSGTVTFDDERAILVRLSKIAIGRSASVVAHNLVRISGGERLGAAGVVMAIGKAIEASYRNLSTYAFRALPKEISRYIYVLVDDELVRKEALSIHAQYAQDRVPARNVQQPRPRWLGRLKWWRAANAVSESSHVAPEGVPVLDNHAAAASAFYMMS